MTGIGGPISVPSVPRIGYFNVKGGPGKTTISVYSAMKMARLGLTVGIIDMDFTSPKTHYTMGMKKTFRDVADAMDFQNIYPFSYDGVPNLYVFSMGFLVRDALAILLDEQKILEAVTTVFEVVKWPDNLDVFCIDMPPQTSQLNIKISKEILCDKDRDSICLVTTPRIESLMDALRALDMLKFFSVKCMGYVLNMAFHQCGQCGHKEWNGEEMKQIKKMLKVPLICTVPFTNDIEQYLDIEVMLKSVGVALP